MVHRLLMFDGTSITKHLLSLDEFGLNYEISFPVHVFGDYEKHIYTNLMHISNIMVEKLGLILTALYTAGKR